MIIKEILTLEFKENTKSLSGIIKTSCCNMLRLRRTLSEKSLPSYSSLHIS